MTQKIELNYIERGAGACIVFVPGWSQSAQSFQKQIADLSSTYRVIALDLRGHGDSPKPPHGYRIARLAQDLREFLLHHELNEITLAGHSMGASVIWSYIEQFGGDRISKLVFIDQAPLVTNAHDLSGEALLQSGAAFTPQTLFETAQAIASDQAKSLLQFRAGFYSEAASDDDFAAAIEQSLKVPGEYAARLLIDHGAQDWRDVIRHLIPKLELPVLVVGGALATIFPPEAASWIAAQIPGAKLSIFSAAERGSHFMFFENPEKFNALIREFVG